MKIMMLRHLCCESNEVHELAVGRVNHVVFGSERDMSNGLEFHILRGISCFDDDALSFYVVLIIKIRLKRGAGKAAL